MSAQEEPVIAYTVRDLFERQSEALGRIETKLDGKADKADVAVLTVQVNDLQTWKTKVVGIAIGVSVAAGGTASAVLRALGG